MSLNVIITGSSGMIGRGVLLECLDSPKITSILIVNRKTISLSHPKLKEVLVANFLDLESIQKDLNGYDACFFCAGTSAFGMTEDNYHKLTYDLTLNFAQTFIRPNQNSVFCYVSGTGTDSTEKGRQMWARVKGKTENALLKLPFKSTYLFRPGYIQPMKGIKSRTKLYSIFYAVFRPVYTILRRFPRLATNTTNVGRAMINAVAEKSDYNFIGNKEINRLAAND